MNKAEREEQLVASLDRIAASLERIVKLIEQGIEDE